MAQVMSLTWQYCAMTGDDEGQWNSHIFIVEMATGIEDCNHGTTISITASQNYLFPYQLLLVMACDGLDFIVNNGMWLH